MPGGRLGEIRRAQTGYQELTSTDWEAAIAGSHLHLREEGRHHSRHRLTLWTQEGLASHKTPICLRLEASSSPAGIQPCYSKPAGCSRSRQNPPQSCKAVDSRLQAAGTLQGSKQAASSATRTPIGHLVPVNALPASGGPARAPTAPALHAFSEEFPSKAAPVPLLCTQLCIL